LKYVTSYISCLYSYSKQLLLDIQFIYCNTIKRKKACDLNIDTHNLQNPRKLTITTSWYFDSDDLEGDDLGGDDLNIYTYFNTIIIVSHNNSVFTFI